MAFKRVGILTVLGLISYRFYVLYMNVERAEDPHIIKFLDVADSCCKIADSVSNSIELMMYKQRFLMSSVICVTLTASNSTVITVISFIFWLPHLPLVDYVFVESISLMHLVT